MMSNDEISETAITILSGLDECTPEEVLGITNLMNMTIATALFQKRSIKDIVENGMQAK